MPPTARNVNGWSEAQIAALGYLGRADRPVRSSDVAQHLKMLGLVDEKRATSRAGVTLSSLRRNSYAKRRWHEETGALRHEITEEGRRMLRRMQDWVEVG